MTKDVLRNGMPHKVTTSLVTHNAVLPQNVFIKQDPSALLDSGIDESTASAGTRAPSPAFDQSSIDPASQTDPSYPTTKDTLHSNDTLTTIKSHIRDNIQALNNLALSDNWQSLGESRSIEEHKLYLEKKSIQSNRQLISKSTTQRAAPNLATPHDAKSRQLSSSEPAKEAAATHKSLASHAGQQTSTQDSEFQIRVKNLKSHVRNVDSTLQNLDPEK